MKQYKVVVTDWEYADLRYEESVLNSDLIELIPAQCRTEEDVIEACRDADGLINQYAPLSSRVIQHLENCKVIARYGVGVDTIDLASATQKGICVANVPDYCVDEVSDHALALFLSFARKVVNANQYVKQGTWDFKQSRPIHRLRDSAFGLVGFGKIPQALAEKVKVLGVEVIAYDPYVPANIAAEKGVSLVTLEELCTKADVISVHAPLTASTRGLIGKAQFALMKTDAVIVNTSRGPLIDESPLIDALQEGRIAGAALDVLETEPIRADNPLLHMDNVILTPHVAWYSEESEAELRKKTAMGVADVLLHGEYPRYLVNQQVKKSTELAQPNEYVRYADLK